MGDPGVDGRIILRWIFRKWDVRGMDWIELAQNRDRWRVFGDRGGTVVKVLCYKSEGSWFDPRWCHWNFSFT